MVDREQKSTLLLKLLHWIPVEEGDAFGPELGDCILRLFI